MTLYSYKIGNYKWNKIEINFIINILTILILIEYLEIFLLISKY